MIKIFPSLMAANQLNLEHEIKRLEAYCEGFHVDIMDDHFVPNLSMSPATTNQLAQLTNHQLSVHLMVERPEEVFSKLRLNKNSIVSFHIESTKNPEGMIKAIKESGLLPGIAVSPKTAIEDVFPFLSSIYQVLMMTVEPGFSGQVFQHGVLKKIEVLNAYKQTHNLYNLSIAADGGVTKNNIQQLARLGVEVFCIGSAIFDQDEPTEAIMELKNRAQ